MWEFEDFLSREDNIHRIKPQMSGKFPFLSLSSEGLSHHLHLSQNLISVTAYQLNLTITPVYGILEGNKNIMIRSVYW